MPFSVYRLMICCLIFAGIIFMVLSICKFRGNIRLMEEFYFNDNLSRSQTLNVHQFLLFLFLFGYILIFFIYFFDVGFASELLTALIFFFGSLFVFLENSLHKNIVTSIKKNYDATLDITVALEEEREKLLSLNKRLLQTENVTIFALAYEAELRDSVTGNHIARTSKYVQLLTRDLMKKDKYKGYITEEYYTEIVKSAPLHDIGKVAIPDLILQKEGQFTEEEFEIMKKHSEFGADIIRKAMGQLKFRSFLHIAEQLTLSHHEKWDGTGYPNGLKGEAIPLSARIMAVADVYDALRSERQYKKAFSHEKACAIIVGDSGSHFDPDIIDSFVDLADKFEKISMELADRSVDEPLQTFTRRV